MNLPATLLTVCLASVADEPTFHVQPYLQLPDHETIAVKWETTEPAVGEVRFGPTPELDLRAVETEARLVHEVPLSGLLPRTRYYYRVRSGDLTSGLLSFRTPPEHGTDRWRMVVYGDSRSFPERHERVAELAARFDPDVVLHTGDQVSNGTQRPQWKAQFFDPAARLFARVPVVTSLGNHEQNAGNYYEYLALPGNEKFFSLDFGNAHIVALDSNAWGGSARESEQYTWLQADLSKKRAATWNLVFFHHPLFSAHDKRSINRARWDWCPLFENLGVDAVLTGHDHFHYRSWPIGRLGESSSRGITHITTAGGGAPLYQLKTRSYTATQKAVHHVTVLDFVGDRIDGQVVDVEGAVFDRFTITKGATPPAEFCAYEVYELERAIRQEIETRQPYVVGEDAKEFTIDDQLQVSHTFRVPVTARLIWQDSGSPQNGGESLLNLKPAEPLVIPIKRQVALVAGLFHSSEAKISPLPRMKLQFLDDRFRNREIEFSPLKLWRDRTICSQSAPKPADAAQAEKALTPRPFPFVRADGSGPAAVTAYATVRHSEDKLIVIAMLNDTLAKVADDKPAEPTADGVALLKGQNVRLLLATPEHQYSFVVTPDGRRADACDGSWAFDEPDWLAVNRRVEDRWAVEITVPRKLLGAGDGLRVNLVHANPAANVEDCLSPTFDVGSDPDRNPDFRFGDRNVNRFARLVIE